MTLVVRCDPSVAVKKPSAIMALVDVVVMEVLVLDECGVLAVLVVLAEAMALKEGDEAD